MFIHLDYIRKNNFCNIWHNRWNVMQSCCPGKTAGVFKSARHQQWPVRWWALTVRSKSSRPFECINIQYVTERLKELWTRITLQSRPEWCTNVTTSAKPPRDQDIESAGTMSKTYICECNGAQTPSEILLLHMWYQTVRVNPNITEVILLVNILFFFIFFSNSPSCASVERHKWINNLSCPHKTAY